MKKSILIVVILFGLLQTQAQDYLISFTGTGDTTAIASIKVYNLNSGDSVALNGQDILHLHPSNGVAALGKEGTHLKIYPDPVKETSILMLDAPAGGQAVIAISDMSGKTACISTAYLSQGTRFFSISGLTVGTYLVNASGPGYQYSVKLVSEGKPGSKARIEFLPDDNVSSNKRSLQPENNALTVEMPYTTGDLLLYKSISGQYSTIVTDIPTSSKTVTFHFSACRDSEGRTYPTIQEGSQIWMAANLNVGTMTVDTVNQVIAGGPEKYCYENKQSNCNIYGGLYQWNEMMNYDTVPGSQGICPVGWHVPMDAEWTTLMTFLGGDSIAGGKMKETGSAHWAYPNEGATNESGFTALPGGYRYYSGTLFITDYAIFWSSNESGTANAFYRHLQFNYEYVVRRAYTKENGYSVRCLKN
jgi:uncharacterized protein (TIGR02145 family)